MTLQNFTLGTFAQGAAGGGGAFESIASASGTGSSSSITFSSIPSTYQHLQLRWLWRTTATGVYQGCGVRLNGDSGTNYATHRIFADGAAVYVQGSVSQSSAGGPLVVPAASALADSFGVGILDIHDYASTTKNKTFRFFSGWDLNDTNGGVIVSSSLWLNTNAVNSLTVTMANAAHNISSTSRFALYGIKGA